MRNDLVRTAALMAAIVGVSSTGCGNQEGNVAADKFGDRTHPAQRADPLAESRAACGASGATLNTTSFVREPYLQRVSTSSATVGWASSSASDKTVTVTEPGGRVVATAAVTLESTTTAAGGSGRQAWAEITGLSPDTIYCYSIADANGALTEPIGFRTAPPADTQRTVRFLAFGDSGGGGSDEMELRDHMLDVPYELMIHTGDLAYDHGTLEELNRTVFGVYDELLRHLPLFPAAGNHDFDTLDGAPFREVFALPGSRRDTWYSYDWGPIHFAALDTEASYAAQAAWLDEDLSATTLPWKIVYLHKPLYSSGSKHGSDVNLRRVLEPILTKHAVQLVLAGHDHDYERVIAQNGVTYVVTGGGGVGTRDVGSSPFTAFSIAVIHYVLVEVTPEKLTLHAIDATGQEFDSVVVPRTSSPT